MGWRGRDDARWTDRERRAFLRTGSAPPPTRSRRRLTGAQGVGFAALLTAVVFTAGQVPRDPPLAPVLHLSLTGLHRTNEAQSSQATYSVRRRPLGKIRGPATVSVGSILTIRGRVPEARSGAVVLEGTYSTRWARLATARPINGSFTVRIPLRRRGLLHLRLIYPDGSRAVGSLTVR